ncbi:hypothetical protein pb186bvf_016982 [Paramecium bursaria]
MAEEKSISSRSSSSSKQRSRSRSGSKNSRTSRNSKKRTNFRGKKQYRNNEGRHAIQFPNMDGPLLDFEAFQEYYSTQDINQDKLRFYFSVYERKYESRQKELFVENHREEQWIQDKYNPKHRKQFFDERCAQSHLKFAAFVKQFNQGAFNKINFTISEAQLFELCELNDYYYNDEQEQPFWEFYLKEGVDTSKYFVSDPNQFCLFIKSVPLELSRNDILSTISKMAGYVSLTLSEPTKGSRMAWVEFDSEKSCLNILRAYENGFNIKDYSVNFQRQQDKRKIVRIFKAVEQKELLKDLQIQRDLIKALDKEKGITGNPILEGPIKDRDDPAFNKQLDLQSLYLRKVHSYCYWSAGEFSDQRLLVSKAGYLFLRLDVKRNIKLQWQEIIQSLAQKRIDDKPEPTLQELVDNEIAANAAKQKSSSSKPGVVPCLYCNKQFEGQNFLIKHISGKHPSTYEDETQKLSQQVIEQQMNNLYRKERQFKAIVSETNIQ